MHSTASSAPQQIRRPGPLFNWLAVITLIYLILVAVGEMCIRDSHHAAGVGAGGIGLQHEAELAPIVAVVHQLHGDPLAAKLDELLRLDHHADVYKRQAPSHSPASHRTAWPGAPCG